ncbi:MAG: hypothetical protein PHQ32_03370 [Firmicutes bacterium]|nr:hypothetical protein [Bacillota bacterium]
MNFFRKYVSKNCNKGSTLISVLVVTTILSLFLVTLQPIMFKYAARSVQERDMKQADFSARGANRAIVAGIIAENSALIDGINSIPSDGSSLVISDFDFGRTGMGTVEAKILRIEPNKFTVITRATVNSKQRTIARVISKITTEGLPTIEALPAFYFDIINFKNGGGFSTSSKTPVVVGSTLNLNGGILNIAGDLYIMPNSNTFKGNSIIYLQGNLYMGDGSFNISGSAKIYIKGTLYNKTNSAITSSVPSSSIRYCPDIYTGTTVQDNLYSTEPSWVRSSGIDYVDGMTLQGGKYYEMDSNETISNINNQFDSSVTPDNPVFIILKDDSRLNITNAIDPPSGGVAKNPRIVFILEDNSRVYLENKSSAIVYGTENTRLYVENNNNESSNLYGQIHVGRMYHSNNNSIILNYKALVSAGVDTWKAGLFIRTTY